MFLHRINIAETSGSLGDYFVAEVMPLLVIFMFAYYPASLITGFLHRLIDRPVATETGLRLDDEIGPAWSWWILFTLWGVFTSVFYYYWDTGIW